MSVWSVPPLAGCVCAAGCARHVALAASSHCVCGCVVLALAGSDGCGGAPGRGAARALVVFCLPSALTLSGRHYYAIMGVKQRTRLSRVSRASLSRVSTAQRAPAECSIISELTQWGVTLEHPRVRKLQEALCGLLARGRAQRTHHHRTHVRARYTHRNTPCTLRGSAPRPERRFTSESENVNPSPRWWPCYSVRLWLAPSRPLLFVRGHRVCMYVYVD